MSEKVVGLHGPVVLADRDVDGDLVSTLEGLLEEARSGELQGFAYSCLYRSGGTFSGFEGVIGCDVVGAMEFTKFKMLVAILEGGDG